MNILLLGAIGLLTIGMLVPYIACFAPPRSSRSSGRTGAKDALNNDVLTSIVPYFHEECSSGRKKFILPSCERERQGERERERERGGGERI